MDFIIWQYENMVLPAARQYLLPSKCFANLVINSEADLSKVEKCLYDAIVEKRALAGRGPDNPRKDASQPSKEVG